MSSKAAKNKQEPTGWIFLRSLRMALGRPPLWLMSSLLIVLLALPLALPWAEWFDATLANRYQPGSLARSLDETFRQDHREALANLAQGSSRSAAALGVLAVLIGIYAAGGWLQVIVERTRGHSLRRFFSGGARYFWRFSRMTLLTLAMLAGLHWLLYDWPWQTLVLESLLDVPPSDFGRLETLDSERFALSVGWVRDALGALGFALIMCWGTYSRVRLALHDGSSVIWAGLVAFWTMLTHPVQTLRPLLLLLISEALVVTLVLGGLSRHLDAGFALPAVGEEASGMAAGWRILLLALIGLTALAWREILRGASYHAALQVSRAIVPPRRRFDRWKSIGGPGGPQYPTEGGDEYGVAM